MDLTSGKVLPSILQKTDGGDGVMVDDKVGVIVDVGVLVEVGVKVNVGMIVQLGVMDGV